MTVKKKGKHIVLIACGSRTWKNKDLVWQTLDKLVEPYAFVTLIEGGAKGADAFSAWWVRNRAKKASETSNTQPFIHIKVEPHWGANDKMAGPIRNRMMLQLLLASSADHYLVVAFKEDFDLSTNKGGTEDMVRRANESYVDYMVVTGHDD